MIFFHKKVLLFPVFAVLSKFSKLLQRLFKMPSVIADINSGKDLQYQRQRLQMSSFGIHFNTSNYRKISKFRKFPNFNISTIACLVFLSSESDNSFIKRYFEDRFEFNFEFLSEAQLLFCSFLCSCKVLQNFCKDYVFRVACSSN